MALLDFSLWVVYKAIYYYSCVEIFFVTSYESFIKTQSILYIMNLYKSLKTEYPVCDQYMFVEDGNCICVVKTNKNENKIVSLLEPEKYDFILRNDFVGGMNNKILYNNLSQELNF